ncbi:MAG: hypothetical protein ACTTJ3_03315 [Treponema sp.]
MSYLHCASFYILISPFMFVYGVGLERLSILSGNTLNHLHFYLKNIIFVFLSSSVSYFLFHFCINPLHISFLFPLIIVAILFFFEKGVIYLYDGFVANTTQVAEHEKVFTFGTVVFALCESTSYIEVLLIVAISFLFMLFFHTMLKAIRKRIDVFNIENRWKSLPLLLISLSIITSALYFIDAYSF